MSKSAPIGSKIDEAKSWSYSERNDIPALYALSSAYTDACRQDSPNGAEYRGISTRIRWSWSLLNNTLLEGAKRPEPMEAELVLSPPRCRRTI